MQELSQLSKDYSEVNRDVLPGTSVAAVLDNNNEDQIDRNSHQSLPREFQTANCSEAPPLYSLVTVCEHGPQEENGTGLNQVKTTVSQPGITILNNEQNCEQF